MDAVGRYDGGNATWISSGAKGCEGLDRTLKIIVVGDFFCICALVNMMMQVRLLHRQGQAGLQTALVLHHHRFRHHLSIALHMTGLLPSPSCSSRHADLGRHLPRYMHNVQVKYVQMLGLTGDAVRRGLRQATDLTASTCLCVALLSAHDPHLFATSDLYRAYPQIWPNRPAVFHDTAGLLHHRAVKSKARCRHGNHPITPPRDRLPHVVLRATLGMSASVIVDSCRASMIPFYVHCHHLRKRTWLPSYTPQSQPQSCCRSIRNTAPSHRVEDSISKTKYLIKLLPNAGEP